MYTRKILTGLVLFIALKAGHAAVTVGACQPRQHSYPTISAAIAAAHAGDVIDVCPGTYPEQLNITKSLTLEGVVLARQPGVTITAPAAGLKALPANSSNYPQVFANNVNGPVALRNISVDGTNASIVRDTINFPVVTACQIGFLQEFTGITFQNTPGLVQHVSVTGHFVSNASPGSPQQYPNCGTGIEFDNRNEVASVQDSVIDGFGLAGIFSAGKLYADHNIISGSNSGPYQVGIQASTGGTITGNTVSGGMFVQSTGIQGGTLVQGNTVLSWTQGIVEARQVVRNTLLNNSIGISAAWEAEGNLINARAQYPDPSCSSGGCLPGQENKTTFGIDLTCQDDSLTVNNGVVGVGIGFANIKKNESLPPSNLFANVGTSSTSCK